MIETTLLLFAAIGIGLASATSNMDCTCGQNKVQLRSGVIGGKDANINEYPWMVAILNPPYHSGCGATLINSKWILTASHCTSGDPTEFKVRLGEYDQMSDEEDTMDFDVEKIEKHTDGDLALIKVKGNIDISKYTPICLPDPGFDIRGKTITLTGWGEQCHEDDPQQGPCPPLKSDKLQEVDMPVPLSNEVCRLQDNSPLFCFGGNGKSGCHGDSGSGIIYNNDGRWSLVGVVSGPSPGSVDCGLGPEDFGQGPEVSKYMEWIEKTAVGGDSCKN